MNATRRMMAFVATVRLPRMIYGFAVLLAVLSPLFARTAQAAGPSGGPSPVRVVHTSHGTILIYDTQQVLAQSGITTKVVASDVVGRTSAPSTLSPNAVDVLNLHTSVTAVYYNDHFSCAYGAASATATPPANIQLVAALYYGGRQYRIL
jgi:hypothetical protein